MSRFVAGESYNWADPEFTPFLVLKRTAKTIKVSDGSDTWSMKIHYEMDGSEYVKKGHDRYSKYISRPEWRICHEPHTSCFRANRTKIDDEYTLLSFKEDGYWEFYLKKAGYSYKYMFGLPVDKTAPYEAIDIAVKNAPDYTDLFDDEA